GGIYGFTGFGSPISVSIDSDGTVTATMADDPQTEIDRRALAVLADDDTLWWADRAVAGINEAFEVMPLTDDEGIGEVVTELMTTAAQVERTRRYGNGAPPPTSMSGPSPRVG